MFQPIQAYLSYLNASVKNWDYPLGMAQVYMDKTPLFTPKKINFVSNVEDIFLLSQGQQAVEQNFKSDLTKIQALLQANPNYQLYVGIGALGGTLGEHHYPTALHAPIVYFPVKLTIAKYAIEIEQDLKQLKINMPVLCEIFNSLPQFQLNEQHNESEQQLQLLEMQEVSNSLTQCIDGLDNELEKNIRSQAHINPDILNQLLVFIDKFLLKLNTTLSTETDKQPNKAPAIELALSSLDWSKLNTHTKAAERHLYAAPQNFSIFVAPRVSIKNQSQALNYVEKVFDKNQRSSTLTHASSYSASALEYVLRQALNPQMKEVSLEEPLNDHIFVAREEIQKILKYMPQAVSANQKEALYHIFNERLSVLELPPGSEKIALLSAALLSSYLLGQKTIIYSNSFDADTVDILKQNIKDFFSHSQFSPVLILEKGDKAKFKRNLEKNIDFWLSQNSFLQEELADLSSAQSKLEKDIERLGQEIQKHYDSLSLYSYLNLTYREKNDTIQHKQKDFNLLEGTERFQGSLIHFQNTNPKFINTLRRIQTEYDTHQKKISFYHKKQLQEYSRIFNAKFLTHLNFQDLLAYNLPHLIERWLGLHEEHTKIEHDLIKIEQEENKVLLAHSEIAKLKDKLRESQKEFLLTKERKKVLLLLNETENKQTLLNFKSCVVGYESEEKKQEKLQALDFETILEFFPLCIASSMDIHEFIQTQEAVYDNLIIDGAQLLNIAEVAPLLFRAKNVSVLVDTRLPLPQKPYSSCLRAQEGALWNDYLGEFMEYERAQQLQLNYHHSFVFNILSMGNLRPLVEKNKYFLNENRELLPALFDFNNQHFYQNKIKIYNRTPVRQLASAFDLIKVEGLGSVPQLREAAARKTLEVVRDIVQKNYKKYHLSDEFKIKSTPTIGVVALCPLSAQIIHNLLQAEFSHTSLLQHKVVCIYAAEAISFERDVVVVNTFDALTIPESKNFDKLFNSATSKSLLHTVFIHTVPEKNKLVQSYISYIKATQSAHEDNLWEFYLNEADMLYKQLLTQELKVWVQDINEKTTNLKFQIYNQFNERSYTDFDFVLYNPNTTKFVGIEIEGRTLFSSTLNLTAYQKKYQHRQEILERDGWKIISTPYYKSALLAGNSIEALAALPVIQREVARIKKELTQALF